MEEISTSLVAKNILAYLTRVLPIPNIRGVISGAYTFVWPLSPVTEERIVALNSHLSDIFPSNYTVIASPYELQNKIKVEVNWDNPREENRD